MIYNSQLVARNNRKILPIEGSNLKDKDYALLICVHAL
jgi:hypothetical protein